MVKLRGILALLLAVVVGIIPFSVAAANDLSSISQNNRVVVVSKIANENETNVVLKKYKHKKIKSLTNFKSAEVVLVDDLELAKLRNDNSIQVFEDASIKVSKPKEGKQIKEQQIPWGVSRVEADKAWVNTTGKGVKVAVVDSGISKHKDLRDNIKGEFNAIDPKKSAIDDFGHGTHVAGIIAAKDNKIGVVGVAPDVDLYAVKVLDAMGAGYLSDLAEGIEWCINNEIQLINLSVELQKDYPLLSYTINRALSADIIVVAAAGNTFGKSVTYPAAYEGVISVSAIDTNNNIANFSAVGKIDFCAPGVDVYSTHLGNNYTIMSGTSMAAPHVSGVIALMLADLRNDTNNDGVISFLEVMDIMLCNSVDIGTIGYDGIFGKGLVKYPNKSLN
ncbi:MAG TPA: S8 family peptidase [Clostridium sp.]|nr:S8 family peptidase [Clostridium sp.]